MYFQLVETQVLSTQGQPDVNLHRPAAGYAPIQLLHLPRPLRPFEVDDVRARVVTAQVSETNQ